MEKEQLNYTLILHQIRKKLKLSLLEYCIADSIYHLSNNPSSNIPGWCFATKETIANFLGTSQRTIFNNLTKLIEKGLIEKDESTGYIRTTKKWYEKVVLIRMNGEYGEKLGISSDTMKKLHSGYEETSHKTMKKLQTYNNKDSNSNKDTVIKYKNERYERPTGEPPKLYPKNLKRLAELKAKIPIKNL